MRLLHANDRPGEHPPSWYAATAGPLEPFPALRGDARAEVCVVGGGYTGLSAALHLAEAGRDVVLLEAHRVGFGASGRNGGQVGSGMRLEQPELERRFGRRAAQALWALGEDAKALVRGLAARHGIDAAWRDGVAQLERSRRGADAARGRAELMERRYGYRLLEPLDRDGARRLSGSGAFAGGVLDRGAGHIHPLRFALGLARAAAAAGARIFERSEALGLDGGARTASGRVAADHVVLATNGYHDGLRRDVAARVLPINNFIVATEPLGARGAGILPGGMAALDSRFVVNYWRVSEDGRLLFGGGESYGDRFPRDIAALVRRPMLEIYPQLEGVRVDHAWGGTLAITPTRMPDVARLDRATWSAAGYSGHGVALATMAGKALARAICGDRARLDLLAGVRPPAFPGAAFLRRPAMALAMRWCALRDRLGP